MAAQARGRVDGGLATTSRKKPALLPWGLGQSSGDLGGGNAGGGGLASLGSARENSRLADRMSSVTSKTEALAKQVAAC